MRTDLKRIPSTNMGGFCATARNREMAIRTLFHPHFPRTFQHEEVLLHLGVWGVLLRGVLLRKILIKNIACARCHNRAASSAELLDSGRTATATRAAGRWRAARAALPEISLGVGNIALESWLSPTWNRAEIEQGERLMGDCLKDRKTTRTETESTQNRRSRLIHGQEG
jgi:hypothetical protein